MLHPKDFEVNEAWVAFCLNTAPIRTESDGEFNCVALMDAASCFILSSDLVPIRAQEPVRLEFRQLREAAQRHRQQLPSTLYIARGEFSSQPIPEATEHGIDVVIVPGNELLICTGEARLSFAQHFEGAAP